MEVKHTRHYKSVSSSSTDSDEYTPANGKSIAIYEIGGNAAHSNEVKVEIKWNTEILFSTHGDSIQKMADGDRIELTADGSKKLVIKLTNDSDSTETLGGYYKMVEI